MGQRTKKDASYKELGNHCNDIICNRLTRGDENEFGRLFQGFSPNGIDGLDVLEWIKKKQVPSNNIQDTQHSTTQKKSTNPSVSAYVLVETYYNMTVTSQPTQH